MSKKTLCLDFDGVIHSYTSGWQGAGVCTDPPTKHLVPFLIEADRHFTIAIYSSRTHQDGGLQAMQDYVWRAIEEHFDIAFAGDPNNIEPAHDLFNRIQWPDHKPTAYVTIDDRALTFTGDWRDFDPKQLADFQPWNKKPAPQSSGSAAIERHSKSPIRRFLKGVMWALWGRS